MIVHINDKESIIKDPVKKNSVDFQLDKKYDHMILQARNITATIVENPESVENAYNISIFETRNTLVAKMKFCRLPADVCETDQLTQADIKVNVPQLHLVMSEETLKKLIDILLSFDGGNGVQKQIEDAGKVDKAPSKEGLQHEKNPEIRTKPNSLCGSLGEEKWRKKCKRSSEYGRWHD